MPVSKCTSVFKTHDIPFLTSKMFSLGDIGLVLNNRMFLLIDIGLVQSYCSFFFSSLPLLPSYLFLNHSSQEVGMEIINFPEDTAKMRALLESFIHCCVYAFFF